MKRFPVTETRKAPVTDPKPMWLRRIHATGIHGCPAQDCPKCHALLVREAGR